MPLVCARPGDDVDQSSRRSSEFRVEVAGQHLELANRALAEFEGHQEFCLGKIAPCLIRVGAIDKSAGVEMIHAGEICRGARVALAKLGGAGNQHAQIHELSTANRQALDESAIQGRARLLPVQLYQRFPGDDSDGFAGCLFQDETHVQSLCDLQYDAALPHRDESKTLGRNLVVAEGK